MMQASNNHGSRGVSKGAGGVNAVGSSSSALDLGVEALSNQHFDDGLLFEQGQFICKTESSAVRRYYEAIHGVPFAIFAVASRSFWNGMGEFGCFASSR